MRYALIALMAGAALAACADLPATAADKPNVIIVGEDVDRDTVPLNNRVFKRVLEALTDELVQRYDVFDETALTLGTFAQGRTRRSDAEIIDVLRSVRNPPLDVAVIFSIYASARDLNYTTQVRTRIEGRLLHIKDGQRLGSFEVVSPQEWRARPNCDRECVLETVGDHARILAKDLGAVLNDKLAAATPPGGTAGSTTAMARGYMLILDGFNAEELRDVEEYLVVFSGYQRHRPTLQLQRRQELWYESTSDSARINRNLSKMLEHMDMRGRLTFSGNTFTLEKITVRQKRQPIDRSQFAN